MPPPGMKKTNAQKDSEKKAKEAAKNATAAGPVKELTHAQIKERDANAMKAKQAAKAAKEAAGGK